MKTTVYRTEGDEVDFGSEEHFALLRAQAEKRTSLVGAIVAVTSPGDFAPEAQLKAGDLGMVIAAPTEGTGDVWAVFSTPIAGSLPQRIVIGCDVEIVAAAGDVELSEAGRAKVDRIKSEASRHVQ